MARMKIWQKVREINGRIGKEHTNSMRKEKITKKRKRLNDIPYFKLQLVTKWLN
jgi:hypothetical protein